MEFAAINVPPIEIEVSKGTTFSPGVTFMGIDVATWLDDNCDESDRFSPPPLRARA